MKNVVKLLGIAALTLAIVFSFVACDTGTSGGGSTDSTSVTYKSVDSSGSNLDVYELTITKSSSRASVYSAQTDDTYRASVYSVQTDDTYRAAVSSAQTGDTYVLTIYLFSGGTKSSSGTVSGINGDKLTLSGGVSLTVTITGGKMTAMSGTINLTGGGTQPAPASLTSVKDGGDGSLNGTWKKGSETVTINGNSLAYTGTNGNSAGKISYENGMLVTEGTGWKVAGKYTLSGNTVKFSGFNSSSSYYNGDWTK